MSIPSAVKPYPTFKDINTVDVDAAKAAEDAKGAKEQKDMFLKLLVAQLSNQDPSAPMDQKDMMAQMAQFTSVEQMTNMVAAIDKLSFNSAVSQSVGLIGRDIDYSTGNEITSTIESSKVVSVNMVNNEIKLTLENGETIKPDAVVRVTS